MKIELKFTEQEFRATKKAPARTDIGLILYADGEKLFTKIVSHLKKIEELKKVNDSSGIGTYEFGKLQSLFWMQSILDELHSKSIKLIQKEITDIMITVDTLRTDE